MAINQTKFKQIRCKIGLPQGSILWPLLYMIYINTFPVQNSIMYADDTLFMSLSENVSNTVTNHFGLSSFIQLGPVF